MEGSEAGEVSGSGLDRTLTFVQIGFRKQIVGERLNAQIEGRVKTLRIRRRNKW